MPQLFNDETSERDNKDVSELRNRQNDTEFPSRPIGALLEADPRPTFVLVEGKEQDVDPIYLNKALVSNGHLMRGLPFRNKLDHFRPHHKNAALDFIAWIKIVSKTTSARTRTFPFLGLLWTGFVVENWVVLSGDIPPQDARPWDLPPRDKPPVVESSKSQDIMKDSSQEVLRKNDVKELESAAAPTAERQLDHILPAFVSTGTPDWTIAQPVGELSEHVKLVRGIDWSKTSLGAMSTWTKEFRQICNHLMANPHPAALFWGDDLTTIYNEAYSRSVAGRKHPEMLGSGFAGKFYELWYMVKTIFDECRVNGRAVAVDDQMLPIDRLGFVEETFYSWSLVPLYGGTNEVLGMYNAPFDVSRSMRSARAIQTLLQLGQRTSLATTVASFWHHVLDGFQDNENDFPFVILHSVKDGPRTDGHTTSPSSTPVENHDLSKICLLEGTLGVPNDHPLAMTQFDLQSVPDGFAPFYREAMISRKPKLVNLTDGSIPKRMFEGIQWRGFEEPCRYAVVCPLRPTTSDAVLGFLCVGVNPRRPYDQDYESFIELIDRQLASALASVTSLEAEVQRGLTAAQEAAIERSKLTEELAVQQSRLQRIAEVSPVGMFSIDVDGTLLEANNRWHEITGHKLETYYPYSWSEPFTPGKDLENAWRTLHEDKLPWTGELKLDRTLHDDVRGEEVEVWVLAAARPEYVEGEFRGIMGSITDITPQKRSERDLETRARLSEQLLLRTQEAKEIEKNFKRFSDLAPGGLVIMNSEGVIEYANTQWYKVSGCTPSDGEEVPYSWSNAILEDDQAYFALKWTELVTKKKTITIEARMSSPWEGEIAGSRVQAQRWILTSFFPEIVEGGALKSVMGCITDISPIKWAEDLQTRRLAEAEETRRAQNSFIDITSHEMRNPLSAIIQCADGITSTLGGLAATSPAESQKFLDAVNESISSAETIQLCAQHQKNIVDDILTISKLDSNLLVITPVPVQPIHLVEQAIKMFSAEARRLHDMELTFHVNESYRNLSVNTVVLDSSRLLQVLINLMTNAIKFTKTSKKRIINIFIDAYLEPPQRPEFDYFPMKGIKDFDATAGKDWGTGEPLYLHFAVKDTGCGISPAEKDILFRRFQQASPRTHIQYGGSGLGLFISRQLAELQGGEIGVASKPGVGSTFAFYVKCRRSESAPSEKMASHVRAVTQQRIVPTATLPEVLQATQNFAPAPSRKKITKISRQPSIATTAALEDWHILIVEDNLINQRILAQQLRKLGCTVLVANHGQEALDIIEESKAYKGKETSGKELSVVLMDLEMPIMDGLTAVRLIRHLEAEGKLVRHLPIIAVTANARGEQIAAAKDSGMDSVVSKPFRVSELIPKIVELLVDDTKS